MNRKNPRTIPAIDHREVTPKFIQACFISETTKFGEFNVWPIKLLEIKFIISLIGGWAKFANWLQIVPPIKNKKTKIKKLIFIARPIKAIPATTIIIKEELKQASNIVVSMSDVIPPLYPIMKKYKILTKPKIKAAQKAVIVQVRIFEANKSILLGTTNSELLMELSPNSLQSADIVQYEKQITKML